MEKFSASRAQRHMLCHGSANLEVAIPNWVPPEDDPTADNAANRGTRMHEMFALIMGLSAADAFQMAQAIEFVAVLRQRRRFKTLIEVPTRATWLQTQPWTTADLVLHVADELHVIDLKTGVIPVSAADNKQLMYYALTYGSLAPKATGAWLHIVQPWADNMDSWFATAAELADFQHEARKAEQAILNLDTTLTPGDHCLFCPANPHSRAAKGHPLCPTMLQLLYPTVDVDLAEMVKDFD